MSPVKVLIDVCLVLLYIAIMIQGFISLGFTFSQAATSVAFIVGAITITIIFCFQKSE